jgi:NhaP-type Na+/H+ or K+/H+ antiporter
MGIALAVIGGALLLVAAISRRLSGAPLTPAIVVVAIGIVVGPLVLDKLVAPPTSATVRTLAEATLAVVLFSDSSRVDLRALRREAAMPVRLLGVSLVLTIGLGGLVAVALFGRLSVGEAMILAVILAPTDAGLGSAVVTDTRLPQVVRQSLNVESGLNDGICVPVLLILLAVVMGSASDPLRVLGEEIGYGVLGGLVAGATASAVVVFAGRRDLIDETWKQVIPVAAAALAYGLADALDGSGFIAAFVAGALFGLLTRDEGAAVLRFTEGIGQTLDAVTFLVFGAVLLGPSLRHVTWQIALYAVLSLTVVRTVPVALSLVGTGAKAPTVAFLGWFGPRGLASIVFAVIVEDAHVPRAATVVTITYLTVGLSVLAHGLSAAPLVGRYVGWYQSTSLEDPASMEVGGAHEHRARSVGFTGPPQRT